MLNRMLNIVQFSLISTHIQHAVLHGNCHYHMYGSNDANIGFTVVSDKDDHQQIPMTLRICFFLLQNQTLLLMVFFTLGPDYSHFPAPMFSFSAPIIFVLVSQRTNVFFQCRTMFVLVSQRTYVFIQCITIFVLVRQRTYVFIQCRTMFVFISQRTYVFIQCPTIFVFVSQRT